MRPIDFDQKNRTISRPQDMSDDQCGSLPLYTDKRVCISLWQASWKERLRFMMTGKLWLWVFSGMTQPPVLLDLESPFSTKDKKQ